MDQPPKVTSANSGSSSAQAKAQKSDVQVQRREKGQETIKESVENYKQNSDNKNQFPEDEKAEIEAVILLF